VSAPVTVKLSEPVAWLQGVTVDVLTLVPRTRDLKNFKVTTAPGGGMVIEPYALAVVGLRMAGMPEAFLDKMCIADMNEVAGVVLGFLNQSPRTGEEPSP
jgi:hypothetical protein